MSIFKVQTDADEVLVEFNSVIAIHRVDSGGGCHVKAATISVIAGGIPQIDKQIFDLESPVFGKCHFNSRADSPAEFRVGLVRQAGQGRLYIRTRAAPAVP